MSRHVKMLGCGKILSVGGEFVVQKVVELLLARPLVVLYNMSVAGVGVVALIVFPLVRRGPHDKSTTRRGPDFLHHCIKPLRYEKPDRTVVERIFVTEIG